MLGVIGEQHKQHPTQIAHTSTRPYAGCAEVLLPHGSGRLQARYGAAGGSSVSGSRPCAADHPACEAQAQRRPRGRLLLPVWRGRQLAAEQAPLRGHTSTRCVCAQKAPMLTTQACSASPRRSPALRRSTRRETRRQSARRASSKQSGTPSATAWHSSVNVTLQTGRAAGLQRPRRTPSARSARRRMPPAAMRRRTSRSSPACSKSTSSVRCDGARRDPDVQ